MKHKVTKFMAEIIMNELAEGTYLEDILNSEEIYSVKITKKEDIEIDIH